MRGIAESVKLKEVNYLSSLVNSVCAEVDIECGTVMINKATVAVGKIPECKEENY